MVGTMNVLRLGINASDSVARTSFVPSQREYKRLNARARIVLTSDCPKPQLVDMLPEWSSGIRFQS